MLGETLLIGGRQAALLPEDEQLVLQQRVFDRGHLVRRERAELDAAAAGHGRAKAVRTLDRCELHCCVARLSGDVDSPRCGVKHLFG